ncbi:DJ-1/PfpI family protein [Croceiramulus getboli]|nr:DJ-1/PfpI family protein [Flavobacteriaceae bacterium YJPT1-3]
MKFNLLLRRLRWSLGLVCGLVLLFQSCTDTAKTDSIAERTTVTAKRVNPVPSLAADRYNVAFLIMDGTYNTELTAPYDIFQHTQFRESIKAMNVFTVANTKSPITTFEGLRLLPDFDYTTDSLPTIDILVVPSAEHHLDSDLEDEILLDFVRKVDKQATFVTSHCDGAFVLAAAGLLDDHVCTTFPADINTMRARFPELDIRKDVLFVHDGKYITSAGGAKSFEAALYLTEILYGDSIARSLSSGLVIDWDLKAVPHLIVAD